MCKSVFAQSAESGVHVSGGVIAALIVAVVVVLVLLVVLYMAFKKIKRINSRLEAQRDEIECQKNLILVKNEQITDSINYARKIQDSILVPEAKIRRWMPDMFVYYKPKDIVSGDFYWFSRYESKYVITAIDCTGHGVPGAFLSMIGNTLLHEIVNIKHVFKPDQILAMLHTGITLALNQDSEDSGSEDGMDMSLCTVDARLNRFQFAGAKNSIYVVQGDKLKVLKANYYSVGGKSLRPGMKVEFTCYDFMYDENTSIYMFSDGSRQPHTADVRAEGCNYQNHGTMDRRPSADRRLLGDGCKTCRTWQTRRTAIKPGTKSHCLNK